MSFLKYIIEDMETPDGIRCNKNEFWKYTNKDNRTDLINEVARVHEFNVKDRAYFSILNNMANGNKYGINDVYEPELNAPEQDQDLEKE